MPGMGQMLDQGAASMPAPPQQGAAPPVESEMPPQMVLCPGCGQEFDATVNPAPENPEMMATEPDGDEGMNPSKPPDGDGDEFDQVAARYQKPGTRGGGDPRKQAELMRAF